MTPFPLSLPTRQPSSGTAVALNHVVGIAGARRNACVAIWKDGAIQGITELERLTRVRHVGLAAGQFPEAALEAAGRGWQAADAFVAAEKEVELPESVSPVRIDHHAAHASAAFLTSPFDRAVVLVCDHHSSPEVSVWRGNGDAVCSCPWPWNGAGFARVYSTCARILGYSGEGQEHKLETLARIGRPTRLERLAELWRGGGDRIELRLGWEHALERMVADAGSAIAARADIAASIQQRLGELLVDLLRDVKHALGGDDVCLGGGLFYNTFLTTFVAQSQLFSRAFVPINPGNPGLAAGAALAIAGQHPQPGASSLSPFLGPGYSLEEIKETLDNCKLTYDLASEDELIDRTVAALKRGHLVGWFQDRMEWGPRALGNRSILVDPRHPHALENLNQFLKKGDAHRAYGMSVLLEQLQDHFTGPAESPHMEYEYGVRNPDLLAPALPAGAAAVRVQTIAPGASLFGRLHRAYRSTTGLGALINTSFNGFLEPIVCSPRDAVRVFYGTGLDLLVLGRFIVAK